MIRPWEPQDFSAIADILLHLRARSEWSKWQDIETSKEDGVRWLLECYAKASYRAWVWINDQNELEGCVGACLDETRHPPHLRHVVEWCLYGKTTRHVAALWQEAKAWGKGRGAILALRGTAQKTHQTLKWEKL